MGLWPLAGWFPGPAEVEMQIWVCIFVIEMLILVRLRHLGAEQKTVAHGW